MIVFLMELIMLQIQQNVVALIKVANQAEEKL